MAISLNKVLQVLALAERELLGSSALAPDKLPTPDTPERWCLRCGATIAPGRSSWAGGAIGASICPNCAGARLLRDATIRLAEHDGVWRDAVLAVKHGGDRQRAKQLGRLLADQSKRCGVAEGAVVIPVPMPLARRIDRGIDHAAEIARACARRLGARMIQPLRHEEGSMQARLGAAARRRGDVRIRSRGARELPAGVRTVLIVDDVLTTGATIEQAAIALRESLGPVRVLAAVVTVAAPHKPFWGNK